MFPNDTPQLFDGYNANELNGEDVNGPGEPWPIDVTSTTTSQSFSPFVGPLTYWDDIRIELCPKAERRTVVPPHERRTVRAGVR